VCKAVDVPLGYGVSSTGNIRLGSCDVGVRGASVELEVGCAVVTSWDPEVNVSFDDIVCKAVGV
jgi:hypothetical protein